MGYFFFLHKIYDQVNQPQHCPLGRISLSSVFQGHPLMNHIRFGVQLTTLFQAKPSINQAWIVFFFFFFFPFSWSLGSVIYLKNRWEKDTIIIEVDTVLVQATITKFHRWSSLKNRHLFLTFLEVEKFKIQVPTSLVSGEGQPLGSETVAILQHPHVTDSILGSSSPCKGTYPIMGSLLPKPHPNLVASQVLTSYCHHTGD